MDTKETKGVIYILTNPSFPELVKLGYAKDLEKRLKQLNRSEALPYAFRAYAKYEVESSLTDLELHKLIVSLNPDLRTIETTSDGKKRVREFYVMTKEEAYGILECIAKISGTTDRLKRVKATGQELEDEKQAAKIKEEAKRGPFHFSQCGIKPGERIQYVEDESIQPVVVDDRRIEWNGQTTSLSALAQQLKGFNHPVQGTLWFKYLGQVLNDLRLAMEKK